MSSPLLPTVLLLALLPSSLPLPSPPPPTDDPVASRPAAPALARAAARAPVAEAIVDDELIARTEDMNFSREDYEDWLFKHYGVLHLNHYITNQLVLRAADERDMLPTDDEVRLAYEAEEAEIVQDFYRNDHARYVSDHIEAKLGFTRETYRAVRMDVMRVRLAQHALARSLREVTEAGLEQRYLGVYGEDGEHVVIEALRFNMYKDVDPSRPIDRATLRQTCRERAEVIAQDFASGTPVADLLAATDPIISDFVVDGRLERYQRNMLGVEVDKALASLDDAGEVTPLIAVSDGFYVVRLVSRRAVSLEQARAEMSEWILTRPVEDGEEATARAWARELYPTEQLYP